MIEFEFPDTKKYRAWTEELYELRDELGLTKEYGKNLLLVVDRCLTELAVRQAAIAPKISKK